MSESTTAPVITGLACGIALVVLFSFLFSANAIRSSASDNSRKMEEASAHNACLPKTLSSVAVNFPVKQPAAASMPAGFNLEGVDSAGGVLIMYYADHSLCPFTESFSGQIDKGAIVITVGKIDGINDSTTFQNEQIAYYANHTETIAKVQLITINGIGKGVGWEPFTGTNTVTLDGEVINQELVKMPGWVIFYDDNDGTHYAIRAHQTLQELVNIAQSLHG